MKWSALSTVDKHKVEKRKKYRPWTFQSIRSVKELKDKGIIEAGWRSDTVGYALEIEADEHIVHHSPRERKGTSHGERFNALIQILNRHPINRGYPDAWQTVKTEVYSFPRSPAKNLTILSYAHDSTDIQKKWPV